MTQEQTIHVEVAYALPEKQAIVPLDVPLGTTAQEAAERSGIADQFEGLALEGAKLGIFGKAVPGSQVLADGERVEIYRPLLIDPKEVRKARAAEVKERKAKEAAEAARK